MQVPVQCKAAKNTQPSIYFQRKNLVVLLVLTMTIVEMSVHMDCAGCEKKIRNSLLKLKGVDDIDIDMVRQKVTVTGWADQRKVLKAVRKTGRTAVLWPYPDNAQYLGYNQQYQHQHQHQHQQANSYVTYTDHPYACASSSSYNYRKHGYDDSLTHGYYHQMPAPYYAVVDDRAGALFSDDNPNACSIM